MFFKSEAHRARFLAAVKNHIDQGRVDPEYGAALYILTSSVALYEKAKPYISRNGILFSDMLTETDFSHGQLLLVQLAGNLFNGQTKVSPVDFMILDADNFTVVQEALRTRYAPPYTAELTSESDKN